MSFKHTSWVYVNGVAIPKEEYVAPEPTTAMIMPDIKEYKSTITGETITSRSKHREHLRRHGCFEIGNEKLSPPKQPTVAPGIKEEIIKNYHRSR